MRSLIPTAFLTMVLSALGLLAGTRQAVAQTATDTFQVRAQVNKTCTVVANDLDFGVYTCPSRAAPRPICRCSARRRPPSRSRSGRAARATATIAG